MPKGFFYASTLKSQPRVAGFLPKCGACGFYKSCKTPKMPWSGGGKKGILIVGEWPTAIEDDDGRHFIGSGGQLLEEALEELGVDMRKDCWLTNALICHPENSHKSNDREIDYCRPNLLQTVRELQPTVIILMGTAAVQSYISHVWKDSPGGISRWVGWQIPCQKPNVWICPIHHPTYLQREKNSVLEMHWRKHLAAAVAKTSKPWAELPDYHSQIEVIMDPNEAARVLRKMQEKGGPIAGDYENNTLKPEAKGARIVSCAMSWRGKKTISYPWHGAAIQATMDLWQDPSCEFIASNLKHEDRWTRKAGATKPINWLWDTMLAAHVLDNRKGICGLKFIAFVLLGAEAWDGDVGEFLKGHKGSHINQIDTEVDIRQLLTYGAIDTLLEYLIAEIQMEQMGKKFI